MRALILFSTFLALVAPSALMADDDDVAVIVNKTNAADNLTKAELCKLLLGEQATWPGGKKVSVILRAPGEADRTAVLHAACGMNENDFTQRLMRANFDGATGGGPKIAPTPLAVRTLVGTTPGAIGFLRASQVNDSVKVISVEGVAAGKAGYLLKASN